MTDPNRLVMMLLDVVALVQVLWLFRRRGASTFGVVVGGGVALGWLGGIHAVLTGTALPDHVPAAAFLLAVVVGVGAVGAVLAFGPVRSVLGSFTDEDLVSLQGVRVLFGATFLGQAVLAVLPSPFGFIDGTTHLLAGVLGLVAARALKSGRGSSLAWLANVFGLLDIAVVLSSLSAVLIPEVGARHPMMYAVFLPAPFWAWWHLLSLSRLVRGSRAGLVARSPSA